MNISQSTSVQPKYNPVPIFIVILVVIIGLLIFFKLLSGKPENIMPSINTSITSYSNAFFEKDSLKKIATEEEFISIFTSVPSPQMDVLEARGNMLTKTSATAPVEGMNQTVERTSSTNVQVAGIDEPDIVKTDNASIYYSQSGYAPYLRGNEGFVKSRVPGGISKPTRFQTKSEVVSVNALRPTDMKVQSVLPTSGDMVISNKVLVVFTSSEKGTLLLEGYSIINPSAPKKLWELPFSSGVQKVGARLYNNMIFLITSTTPILSHPCPMPFIEGKAHSQLKCTDIYIPSSLPPSDVVYSVLQIDPNTGGVKKSLSIGGQSELTTVYMSKEYIYLSYHMNGNSIQILNQFIAENKGVFPQYIEDKMKKLDSYDISLSTKEIEMNALLGRYLEVMDGDESLEKENQLNNAFKHFLNKYRRSFEYTGIIKIKNDTLSLYAIGKVPGSTLNQFSFDEWKSDLRVATTMGGQNPFYMMGGNDLTGQVSDVYVLGDRLNLKGSVKDLGKTERIYAVRFVEDRGYVVTFRQTDPFYVLDLSNGYSPQLKGELKIPGYSSYLHPIDKHLVLGIGRESQVKLSLFDVSDPTTPKEVSQYELAGEYWSEAMNNHHAFLHDAKYNAFFLPGGRGGYVFSYDANTLSLVKALESSEVKRGVYINDYLYIIANDGITSYREGTWDKVGEISFEKNSSSINTEIPFELQELTAEMDRSNKR